LIGDETIYQVYGLTQALGDAKGGKTKQKDVRCDETFVVSLSSKPEKGVIAIAAPWDALPREPQVIYRTQKVYVDAARDFLKRKGIDQPEVKIESILRVDLDGDGEEEVLISATNYFSKDNRVPMRSPAGSYVAIAPSGRRQSGNATGGRRVSPKGLLKEKRQLRRAECL
jgi:hypothetical protein